MRSAVVRATSLLCVVALCSGCAGVLVGAGVGAGGVMYAKGKVKAVLDHPVGAIHSATVRALTDMGLPVEVDSVDTTVAHVQSHYSDGKPIRIRIEAITEQMSEIRIRAGHVGSESRAQRLLDAIQARL